MGDAYNSSTSEVETIGSHVQDHPQLRSKFEATLRHTNSKIVLQNKFTTWEPGDSKASNSNYFPKFWVSKQITDEQNFPKLILLFSFDFYLELTEETKFLGSTCDNQNTTLEK